MRSRTLLVVLVACALGISLGWSASSLRPTAEAQEPKAVDTHGWIGTETVKTRFGDFEFKNGYPTPEAAEALLDQLKFNRAIEVYLTQIPGRRHHRIAARHPRLRSQDAPTRSSSGNTLMDAETLLLTANTETVYAHGLPRPEGGWPDRRRSAAEDARRRDGYVAALSRRYRPARAGQGQGRQVSVSAAGLRGRGAGRLLRRQVADLQRQLLACAASRWTARPIKPSRS